MELCEYCKKPTCYKICKTCKSWYCEGCCWITDDNNPRDLCSNCFSHMWCCFCKSLYTIGFYEMCYKCQFCHGCNNKLIDGYCNICDTMFCPECKENIIYDNICSSCTCKKCDSEMMLSEDKKSLYCITCLKN